MKVPAAVATKIAELADKVVDVNDNTTEADAGLEGATWLLEHQSLFALEALARWFVSKIELSIKNQAKRTASDQLCFPELGRAYIQVTPSRVQHQNAMNRQDWRNALIQFRTRRDNSADAYKRFVAAYKQVWPLLTDEDLTTADVMKKAA
jgi:hypothetical protein